jgi:glycerophosphoryl diester phosphodiesterase
VSIRRAAQGAWAAGFQNERVTKRGLLTAQRLGLETTVYTVNDEARMLELQRLGVSGIFTDNPSLMLSALERRKVD